MLQGPNVARLNFAHGTLQGHTEDIKRICAVASRLQRYCMIMADLPGVKILAEAVSDTHFVSIGSLLEVDFGDLIDYLGNDSSRKNGGS